MRLSGRKPSSFTRPWTQRQRVVLLTLIGANIAAFAVQLALQQYDPAFVGTYLALSQDGVQNAYAWQFLTAAWLHHGLHDGVWHLLGNMLVLYLLGRDVESIIGQGHFLLLYVAGALAGELGHLFMMPTGTVLFAASGGIAAVLMAYSTILPELELVLRIKAKHVAWAAIGASALLVVVDRTGTITHSAFLGGCAAGWLYAHLLGFGRPSFLQRALYQRKANAERYRQMNAEQFIAEEVDPLLEKISREGVNSLTRAERRILAQAREKLAEQV